MQKILIVEDDEKLRDEIEIFFGHNGYETESLRKFDNTIQDIIDINPDLVLLDINLPGVDGEYVCKEVRILLAKTNSLLRRSSIGNAQDKINAKDFVINLSDSTVVKGEKIIELTKNELKILKYLTENRNKIVSREEIMDYLWESESFIDDNTLTVNITRLRNKLEELNLKELLETRRGQGYILKFEK